MFAESHRARSAINGPRPDASVTPGRRVTVSAGVSRAYMVLPYRASSLAVVVLSLCEILEAGQTLVLPWARAGLAEPVTVHRLAGNRD